jgi:predicted kinase
MDDFRQRLFPGAAHDAETRRRAYAAMHMTAGYLLRVPVSPVVVVATYGPRDRRAGVAALAEWVDFRFYLVECHVDVPTALNRFRLRRPDHAANDLTTDRVAELVSGYPYFGNGWTLSEGFSPADALNNIVAYLASGAPVDLDDWVAAGC